MRTFLCNSWKFIVAISTVVGLLSTIYGFISMLQHEPDGRSGRKSRPRRVTWIVILMLCILTICLTAFVSHTSVKIPKVTESTLDSARQTLQELGLEVKAEPKKSQPTDTVVQQSVPIGEYVSEGFSVILYTKYTNHEDQWPLVDSSSTNDDIPVENSTPVEDSEDPPPINSDMLDNQTEGPDLTGLEIPNGRDHDILAAKVDNEDIIFYLDYAKRRNSSINVYYTAYYPWANGSLQESEGENYRLWMQFDTDLAVGEYSSDSKGSSGGASFHLYTKKVGEHWQDEYKAKYNSSTLKQEGSYTYCITERDENWALYSGSIDAVLENSSSYDVAHGANKTITLTGNFSFLISA